MSKYREKAAALAAQMDSAFCGLDGSAFSSDRSSGSDF